MSNQHPQIEHYLKHATRGLWGKKRAEVREELAAHLHDRILAHRLGGMSDQDAIERAVRELGEPGYVNRGMLTLYTAPTILALGLIAAACTAFATTALLLLFTPTRAQEVPVTYQVPTEVCLDTNGILSRDKVCETHEPWLHVPTVATYLEPHGILVTHDEHVLHVRMRDGSLTGYVPLLQEVFIGASSVPTTGEYIGAWTFVRALGEITRGPLRIEGWTNPRIHIGDISFVLGTPEAPADPHDHYISVLQELIRRTRVGVLGYSTAVRVLPQLGAFGADLFERRALHVDAADGTAYGIIIRHAEPFTSPDGTTVDASFTIDVAPAIEGTVMLVAPHEVTFVGTLRELTAPEVSATLAALVRLDGILGPSGHQHEVVLPTE